MIKVIRFGLLVLIIALFATCGGNSQARQYDRMLVIGDSISRGVGASGLNHSFSALVAEELGVAYTVLGAEGSGYESAIHVWERDNYAAYEPSLIVIELGIHNANAGQDRIEFRRDVRELIAIATDTGAEVVVCTMFHAVKENHPRYDTFVLFNQIIRQEAHAAEVGVCDLWQASLDYQQYLSQDTDITAHKIKADNPFRGDNFHPNDKGHRLIADIILEQIEQGYWEQ